MRSATGLQLIARGRERHAAGGQGPEQGRISHVYHRANRRSPCAGLGSAKTLPEYVRALKELGVERYDSYLADGHSEYFGQDGQRVVSSPAHEVLAVAETGQRETFLEHLRRHERRETTYLEMSLGLAQSGIEKWTVGGKILSPRMLAGGIKSFSRTYGIRGK